MCVYVSTNGSCSCSPVRLPPLVTSSDMICVRAVLQGTLLGLFALLLQSQQHATCHGMLSSATAARTSDETATSIADLPPAVLRNILGRVSCRRIAGAQRHAAVSQSWRQLAASNVELLHLLVQQEHLSDAQAARLVAYLERHGHHVVSLHLLGSAGQKTPLLQQALEGRRCCLFNLKTLILEGGPSFLDLAPHLRHLCCLEHLSTSMRMTHDRHSDEGVYLIAPQDAWHPVPAMARLCPPSLTSLTLYISLSIRLNVEEPRLWLDARLQQLLPPRLQQLHLKGSRGATLQPGTLRHLSHLRHLSLECLVPADIDELQQLGSLQELALPGTPLAPDDLVSLSDKVTVYHFRGDKDVAQLTALTALTFTYPSRGPGPDLAACTRLQCLQVTCMGGADSGTWLAGLTRVTSLRRLGLEGGGVPAEQLGVVSQLTWLTSLAIGSLGLYVDDQPLLPPLPVLSESEEEGEEEEEQQGEGEGGAGQGLEQQQQQQQQQGQDPRVPLVSALRGLRHLEVPEEVLLSPGAQHMLDALTALTRLDIDAMMGYEARAQECWDTLREWLGVGLVQLPAAAAVLTEVPLEQQQQQQQQEEEEVPAHILKSERRLRQWQKQQQLEEMERRWPATCLADQQQQRGRPLQHVVYVAREYMGDGVEEPKEVLPSPLPGVRVTVQGGWPPMLAECVLPQRPCPALGGVWEMAA